MTGNKMKLVLVVLALGLFVCESARAKTPIEAVGFYRPLMSEREFQIRTGIELAGRVPTIHTIGEHEFEAVDATFADDVFNFPIINLRDTTKRMEWIRGLETRFRQNWVSANTFSGMLFVSAMQNSKLAKAIDLPFLAREMQDGVQVFDPYSALVHVLKDPLKFFPNQQRLLWLDILAAHRSPDGTSTVASTLSDHYSERAVLAVETVTKLSGLVKAALLHGGGFLNLRDELIESAVNAHTYAAENSPALVDLKLLVAAYDPVE